MANPTSDPPRVLFDTMPSSTEYIEPLIQAGFFTNVFLYISFTVLVFDHLLTFSREIECIWQRKMTPFSVLFLLNRYFALAVMSRIVVASVTHCANQCNLGQQSLWYGDLHISLILLSTLTVLITEAMLILRVYAVYQNSKPILGLLSSAWIVHLSLMIFALAYHRNVQPACPTYPSYFGALEKAKWSLALSKWAGALYVSPAIVFDTIVGACLTLGLCRRSGVYKAKMPLTRLIMRDGLLYFVVVFVTNIFWILVHVLESNNPSTMAVGFVQLQIWSACITTTMIGRLTINLRMYDPAANDELTFQIMTRLRFQPSCPYMLLT